MQRASTLYFNSNNSFLVVKYIEDPLTSKDLEGWKKIAVFFSF